MNVHPIRNEADYERSIAEIDRLWGAQGGTEDGDLLDVLLVLVEDYEAKHHPILPPDPIEAIRFRMEQMNLSRKELEAYIGPRGRVAEIFNGRRSLTLPMIRRLHRELHIPLESLIQESGVNHR